uniref:Uncharacterized protein n=1 Tax=Romanomermis culicivorax TaxID=13658 RepID=A0A915J262_ROMCU
SFSSVLKSEIFPALRADQKKTKKNKKQKNKKEKLNINEKGIGNRKENNKRKRDKKQKTANNEEKEQQNEKKSKKREEMKKNGQKRGKNKKKPKMNKTTKEKEMTEEAKIEKFSLRLKLTVQTNKIGKKSRACTKPDAKTTTTVLKNTCTVYDRTNNKAKMDNKVDMAPCIKGQPAVDNVSLGKMITDVGGKIDR